MSAEHPQHDTPSPEQGQAPTQELPKHPFTRALETWEAWSMANTMRSALATAREQGDHETLARFERYPEWTQGPGPLEALAANREVVQLMTGWQWQAMRAARQQGYGWQGIGEALGVDAEQARQAYLAAIERQELAADAMSDLGPLLRFDPRWRELADDNDAGDER
jgi:hypothetical protein